MRGRALIVDVCDYSNRTMCNIYDNKSDVSGQAKEVFITYERNGWKEISFEIPSKCYTSEGEEDNYRLQYIIGDYRLKAVTDYGTEWFLITNNSVNHQAFSKNVSVTAGHISQLLKNRALDLEFSDEEGNNVGTAGAFLDTILESTGWKVGKVAFFCEDDDENKEKIRSLNAPVKTGALRLVQMVAELFEAKPIFRSEFEDGKWVNYVDLLPMNPFSQLEEGTIPDAVYPGAIDNIRYLSDSKVIELHYDRAVKGLERKTNTENIATRLYGYGAYGDATTKYCSIQTGTHEEYVYTISETKEGEFQVKDSEGIIRYFTAAVNAGDILVWSMLDTNSQSYVWNNTQEIAYPVYKTPKGNSTVLEGETEEVMNYFPFLSDYSYYKNVGLLTDEMFQGVAKYQRTMAEKYKAVIDKQSEINLAMQQLSTVGVSLSGYLRLDVANCQALDTGSVLTLNWSEEHPDGVMWRSDYLQSEKNYFQWHVAQSLKANGDPISGAASIIYVIHKSQVENPEYPRMVAEEIQGYGRKKEALEECLEDFKQSLNYLIEGSDEWHETMAHIAFIQEEIRHCSINISILESIASRSQSLTWECAYLKDIDGRGHYDEDGIWVRDDYDYANSEGDKPHVITIWKNLEIKEDDIVLLFCRNSITGKLGALFSSDEAAVEILKNHTKIKTETHPTIFIDETQPLPAIDFTSYGWCYKYNRTDDSPGTLYFCWAERNDDKWKDVYMQDTEPSPKAGAYFLNTKGATLWHGESVDGNLKWVHLESVPDETEVAKQFGIVFMECRTRDMIYKGLYENYYYQTGVSLSPGNYTFPSEFGYYWMFTTKQTIPKDDELRLYTTKKYVYQDSDISHIVTATTYPYNTLIYPSSNDLEDALFTAGSLYFNEKGKDGTELETDRWYRSNFIPIWPNETYHYYLPDDSFIVLYDANRNYLGYNSSLLTEGNFSTTVNTEYGIVDSDAYVQFKKAKYLKLVVNASNVNPDTISDDYYIRLNDYNTCCFADNVKYTILSPLTTREEDSPIGINTMMNKLCDLTGLLYDKLIPELQVLQQAIKDANYEQVELLGDILREGWLQDDSYVKGDEDRLYRDTLSNLKKVAQPEITYTLQFLDPYGSNPEEGISELSKIEWPDIQIIDAPHLIDPELDINQWAYFDRVKKCFDQPWKTEIEINTQLTLMGQHEFTDVLTRIADVARETKAKQIVYKRAEAISEDGTISAEVLNGEVNTSDVKITGGSTGWSTDEKGNMILESADGLAAIRFNGSGLSMANSKDVYGSWEWKQFGNGFGLNAETINFGYMKGERIEAHTITADKLMANVGNSLDIGSNKALSLYATLDGQKPSGALKTTDSIIEVYAGSEDASVEWREYRDYIRGNTVYYTPEGESEPRSYVCIKDHTSGDSFESNYWEEYDGYTPAKINVMSGGSINLIAGSDSENPKSPPEINIGSQGSINMASGTEINLLSGSDMNLLSDADINLRAGANLNLLALDGVTKWTKNTDYTVNDERIYGGKYYICKTAHRSGDEFDTAKWNEDTESRGSINIAACNDINMTSGSSINMESNSDLNLIGANLNMAANGELNLLGSKINMLAYENGDDSTPSEINMNSGKFNITGSDITFSSGNFTVENDANFVVKTGNFRVNAEASYIVEAGNFKIKEDGSVLLIGNVETEAGMIANWHITNGYLGNTANLETSTVGMRSSYASNQVVFWAGGAPADGTNFSNVPYRVYDNGDVNIANLIATNISVAADKLMFTSTLSASKAIKDAKQAGLDAKSSVEKITDGTTAVKKLSSTGFTIDGDTFTMNSTGSMSLGSATISPTSFTLASGITFQAANGNLTIDSSNNVAVGGWSTNGGISKGTDKAHIHLANYQEETNYGNYLIWAGANLPETSSSTALSPAPFAVDSDGNVYATKFVKRVWSYSNSSWTKTDTEL